MFGKSLYALIISTGILASSAAFAQAMPTGSGIPTFDVASVMQEMRTYQQLQQQYTAITGSYGRGQTGLSSAISSAQVVPGSWQEVVAMQNSGAYGAKQNYYESQINTLPSSTFANPQSQQAMDYKNSTDSVRASLASGDALYAETQTHLNNITTLSGQVDSTTNIKDAQDLQNRIASETAMLQSDQAKLSALNTNLAAQQLNHQNQNTAQNQNFFQWNNNR